MSSDRQETYALDREGDIVLLKNQNSFWPRDLNYRAAAPIHYRSLSNAGPVLVKQRRLKAQQIRRWIGNVKQPTSGYPKDQSRIIIPNHAALEKELGNND